MTRNLVLLVVGMNALVFIIGIVWPPPAMWPEDEGSEEGEERAGINSHGKGIHLGHATCNRNLAPSGDQGF